MMTKEDIQTYLKYNNLFYDECKRVAKEMERFDSNYKFADYFDYGEDEIYCKGEEYWAYGGHEVHEKWFQTELLHYTDEELKKYVDKLIEEKEIKEQEKKENERKRIEAKEREEYERLKQKYN